MLLGKLLFLNIGAIQELKHANGTVQSGIYKKSTNKELKISKNGIVGDTQADLAAHGGPDKVACLYPSEHYSWWKKEFNIAFQAGDAGENLSTEGLTEKNVCIGDQFAIGTAIIEVSQPRQPCYKLAAKHGNKHIAKKVQQAGKTGFYFRCVQSGIIKQHESIKLMNRPNPYFTIAEANNIMHIDKLNMEKLHNFFEIEQLSQSWKQYFLKRIKTLHIDTDSHIINPPEID